MNDDTKAVGLFGLFGIGNLGNDSTLQAMLYQARRRQPGTKVLCITATPQAATTLFGIPAIPMGPDFGTAAGQGRIRRMLARLLGEVKQLAVTMGHLRAVDRLIVPGTGALDDFGVSPTWVPYLLLHWCLLARLLRKPVEFVSVGAGPIHHPLSRFFMLNALRLADYRSYRDGTSKRYLQSVGFNSNADPVYPDLAFSLPPEDLAAYPPPSSPPRTIGIGVMGYYGWRNEQENGEAIYQDYIAKLKQFVVWLLDQGYAVRLLMGEIPTDQRPVDEVLAAVASHPAAQAGAITAQLTNTISDVFRGIAATDLVIATRFHNVVCALMLARPVISLGYAVKNEDLLDEMGQHGYSQHVESFSVDRLQEQFLALVANHAAASQTIADTTRRYRRLLDRQYDSLFSDQPLHASRLVTSSNQR